MDEIQDSNEFKLARLMHHSREMHSETYKEMLKRLSGQDNNLQENNSNELDALAKAMHNSIEMHSETYRKILK